MTVKSLSLLPRNYSDIYARHYVVIQCAPNEIYTVLRLIASKNGVLIVCYLHIGNIQHLKLNFYVNVVVLVKSKFQVLM